MTPAIPVDYTESVKPVLLTTLRFTEHNAQQAWRLIRGPYCVPGTGIVEGEYVMNHESEVSLLPAVGHGKRMEAK